LSIFEQGLLLMPDAATTISIVCAGSSFLDQQGSCRAAVGRFLFAKCEHSALANLNSKSMNPICSASYLTKNLRFNLANHWTVKIPLHNLAGGHTVHPLECSANARRVLKERPNYVAGGLQVGTKIFQTPGCKQVSYLAAAILWRLVWWSFSYLPSGRLQIGFAIADSKGVRRAAGAL